ncbi:outer membrane protein OmpA-like peptidoglycan-associated protein [Pelomonas saccharophila]|uniref:Outer membrane protein OmpA-like peptidoglycan-associated protein n=1 Tax=Roseateles saccharophilus TaxID=304 RepID=A0ABU1YIF0_ROSSA|nr:OmpA family protein [Roseateles saccharophilus]MDR7268632.1 outer membrane protein OmpA-like peptidoglycan-associated protein [Roseateles saccharophilus]
MNSSFSMPLRQSATAVLVAAALLATGCSSMSEREQGTAKGAGAGAVAGAIIGSVTGGSAGRGAVIGGAVGAVAGNLWSKRMEDKRAALAQASQGTGVEVARTDDNRLRLNVPSDVSFDTGRADIKPQMRPVLDEVGRNLDPNVHVTIVGHTDSTGSDAINDPLSRERAAAVRDYLSLRGVSTARVSVAGRGSHEPVASNDSEAGRAANRRVEIFLSEQG